MATNDYQQNQKGNGGLIAILAVICAIAAAALIVGILFLTGVISTSGDNVPGVSGEMTAPAIQQQPESVTLESTMYVSNVEYSIYFRSVPAEDPGNIITEILYGTPVTYIEQADPVFAKIRYNGQEGYVKREYLSTTVPPAKGDTTVKYSMWVYNVENSIYLRSEPNESGNNIICEIPVRTEVGFIEKTNGIFTKIKYGDRIGYSKSIYLTDRNKFPSGNGGEYMTVSGVKNSIYLRYRPSDAIDGNVICEIPVGSMVRYISNGNGKYYEVSWNGYTGYATAEYLR